MGLVLKVAAGVVLGLTIVIVGFAVLVGNAFVVKGVAVLVGNAFDDEPNDASEEVPAPEDNSDYVELGKMGKDERLGFRLTGFEPVSGIAPDEFFGVNARPGATLYQATVEVSNRGQTANDSFCDGTSAELIDSQDRDYGPVEILDTNSLDSPWCGGGVAPGSTETVTLGFQVPKRAEPVELALWNSMGLDVDGNKHDVRVTLP